MPSFNSRIQSKFSSFTFFSIGFLSFNVTVMPLLANFKSFNALEISYLGVAVTLGAIFGTTGLQQIASKHVPASQIVNFCLIFACCLITSLYFVDSFFIFLSLWFLVQCCYRSVTLVEAATVRLSASRDLIFEHVRLWGSIGFICIVSVSGILVDVIGIQYTPFIGSLIILALACFYFRIKHLLPESRITKDSLKKTPFSNSLLICVALFSLLILVNALSWASHSPLFLYYSIYLSELGYSNSSISLAWTISTVSEILLFLVLPRFSLSALKMSYLLLSGTLMSALRWIFLFYSSNELVLFGTQVLHAFTYAAIYISTIKLTYFLLPENYKDRGQGYLIATGQGLGFMLGQFYFGKIAAKLPSYLQTYELFMDAFYISMASIVASLVLCIVFFRRQSTCEADLT